MDYSNECSLVRDRAVVAAREEIRLFCRILGYPNNDLNHLIGDDPHGIVDMQEGYMFFNMSDIHVVMKEYERWLKIYGDNNGIRKAVEQWYYYCIDWHNQHSSEEPRWVSVKDRLPEMTKETKGYGESPKVFVIHGDGKIGVMYYCYSYERWEIGGAGMPAPLYWKPIITPEQETERSKGCPNLRSWLAGCPVEGLRDATLEWQTQRERDLEAAHQRVEECKQALEDAIKEEVKLNKF